VRAEFLHAPELGLFEDGFWLLTPDFVGDALDDLTRLRDVGRVGDLDVEQRPRLVL
jgi:hypothetical protein